MKIFILNKGEYLPKKIDNGDWVDLATRTDVNMKAGDVSIIPLGICTKLPKNYTGYVLPRSSTCLKHGIIMANSMGVIENCYCGNNDEWGFIAYAIRDTFIPTGTRIAQFTIAKRKNFLLRFVSTLSDKNRGGFGSTGL